jgi:hypothetical protein
MFAMQSKTLLYAGAFIASMFLFSHCNQQSSTVTAVTHGGYESQLKWGEHLISVGGCGDCHTPKKLGAMGPEDDSTLILSGHPSQMPLPDIDRTMLESKRMVASQTLTFWIGPWGVSYAGNLTPDSTGIGAWTEEQFINALKLGYSKGIKGNRMLLLPMPVQTTNHYTDDELKAMFAYLKTIKPVRNVVPQPLPPVSPPPPPAK